MMAPIYPRLMNPNTAVTTTILKLARDGVRWVCERCTSDAIRPPHARLAVIVQHAGHYNWPALRYPVQNQGRTFDVGRTLSDRGRRGLPGDHGRRPSAHQIPSPETTRGATRGTRRGTIAHGPRGRGASPHIIRLYATGASSYGRGCELSECGRLA